ncbi:hypothetical protein B9Z55_021196 [Caenorhabditis nigoni]|uniref:DUF38 domain-containing protein n=1 Tax=Caenorhabditis nigoni TaxID=1611254 RepID=A0A2G5TRH1_9PELO|nr:hypothetical protein B9Z55_021196 [Caenorhabditis nigoni]
MLLGTVLLLDPICLGFCERYRKNSRSLNGKTTNLENSNIVDVAIRDLELVLKFQKSDLERFDINDGERQNELSSRTQLIKLNTMFRKLNRRIKARNFGIRTYDQSLIVPTLLFADPDTLEMLSLYAEVDDDWEMESDEIVKTEQWKKAEQFFSDIYLMNLKLENVCHFSRFEIKTNSITAGELNTLRKIFVSSPNCDRWEFGFKHFDEREQAELSNIWGPSFFFDYKRHWYFRLKNPEEEALLDFQMFCGQFGGGEGINCITFGVCEIEDVPNGAVIQDYNEN